MKGKEDAKIFATVLLHSQFMLLLKNRPHCESPFDKIDPNSALGKAIDATVTKTVARFALIPYEGLQEQYLTLYVQGIAHWIAGADRVAHVLTCLDEDLKANK